MQFIVLKNKIKRTRLKPSSFFKSGREECIYTLGLRRKNSKFDSKNFSSEVLQYNMGQGNAVNENNRY